MKQPADSRLPDSLAEALAERLSLVPFVRAERDATPPQAIENLAGVDATFRVSTPEGERWFVIEAKSTAGPSSAGAAVAQLRYHLDSLPGTVGILAAPYISPRTAEICRQADVGYLDLAGNCRIAFDRVFISTEGRPNPQPERRVLRSLFSPRAERVLRVLVADPTRYWYVKDLAVEARVSIGHVSKVKALLVERELIGSGPGGVRLTQPGILLDEWASRYAARKRHRQAFFCLKELPDIEVGIGRACAAAETQWALTGLSSAARVAPFVRYQRAEAYVAGDLAPVIEALGLKRVPSGANVHLYEPYDDGVFYAARRHHDAVLVSPVQNYLDLRAVGGRAADGATFLRERVIEPAWGQDR